MTTRLPNDAGIGVVILPMLLALLWGYRAVGRGENLLERRARFVLVLVGEQSQVTTEQLEVSLPIGELHLGQPANVLALAV
jgi:hypothetical protein